MRLSDFGQWAVREAGRPKSPESKVELILKFAQLGLAEPIVRAVAAEGYDTPTPIQLQAIPHVLAGSDMLGCAQTGTGKTAAFALPILDRLAAKLPQSAIDANQPLAAKHAHPNGHDAHRKNHHTKPQAAPHARTNDRRPISVAILCPTRELAVQIGESFQAYGRFLPLRHAVIFGGVSQHHQVRALKAGVDIVVATPGRLLDLMQQGYVDLRHIKVFVLDEADRMLDMGFIHDIRRIVKAVPQQRQTLLFSATMPSEIRTLAASILNNPVSVTVTPVSSTVETISQSVYLVPRNLKSALLAHVLKRDGVERTLVFTRTKHGADKVVRHLSAAGIRAEAIHGNKSQNARSRALQAFKSRTPPVLVATDIASRGIDVDGITHVINFDIPHEPETYVHRIGRTARAGASGVAISFCDAEERGDLKAIERLTKVALKVQHDLPELARPPALSHAHAQSADRNDGDDRRGQQSQRHHHAGGRGAAHAGRAPKGRAAHHAKRSASRDGAAASHASHPNRGAARPSGRASHGGVSNGAKPQAFGQRGRGRGRTGGGR